MPSLGEGEPRRNSCMPLGLVRDQVAESRVFSVRFIPQKFDYKVTNY